jgi:hypothetical protein
MENTQDPNQAILHRLQQLELENQALLDQVKQSASMLSSAKTLEPKLPLPEKLNGDRRQFRGFLHQINLVFFS